MSSTGLKQAKNDNDADDDFDDDDNYGDDNDGDDHDDDFDEDHDFDDYAYDDDDFDGDDNDNDVMKILMRIMILTMMTMMMMITMITMIMMMMMSSFPPFQRARNKEASFIYLFLSNSLFILMYVYACLQQQNKESSEFIQILVRTTMTLHILILRRGWVDKIVFPCRKYKCKGIVNQSGAIRNAAGKLVEG